MAYRCTYSLIPLRTRPSLLPAYVKLLKDEWSHCKSELIPKVVYKEGINLPPCSLGLVELPRNMTHGKETLVGHIRLIPVTNRSRAVYIEAFCIEKAKRGIYVGRTTLTRTEELVGKLGYREVYVRCDLLLEGFYRRHDYMVHKPPAVHTGGANLLGVVNKVVSWHGNTRYPGLESEYDDGPIATEEEVANGVLGCWFVKYLDGRAVQDEGIGNGRG